MSHEIKTRAGNHLWGKVLNDDQIDEEDIRAIEDEAAENLDKDALRAAIRSAPMLDFTRSDGIERYVLDLAASYGTAMRHRRP